MRLFHWLNPVHWVQAIFSSKKYSHLYWAERARLLRGAERDMLHYMKKNDNFHSIATQIETSYNLARDSFGYMFDNFDDFQELRNYKKYQPRHARNKFDARAIRLMITWQKNAQTALTSNKPKCRDC